MISRTGTVHSKIITRYWRRLVLAAIFASSAAPSAEVKRATAATIDEPIFGLYYDPQKVHFAEIRTRELLPACKKALSDIVPRPSTLTLYAQYRTDVKKIYVVGTEDNLKLLVLGNATCDAGIPIMGILQRHHNPRVASDGPMLTDQEVAGLFGDALTRYSNAFGGKGRFFPWLDELTEQARSGCAGQPEFSCPPTYHLLQPDLQEKLTAFRKY